MGEFVSRSPTTPRLFPSVGWKHSPADVDGAVGLVKAASNALSRRSLEDGRGLKRNRLLRAVWLHCEAATAEVGGRLNYADFLYREIDRDLKMIDAAAGWEAAIELALSPSTAARLEDKEAIRRA